MTPYSGTNFVTDVWNNIVNNPASGNHIHFLNATTPYDIPSGATLALAATNTNYLVTGESYNGVKLRPLSNTGLMTITNLRHARLSNFQFYTDLGATYTADFIRIVGTTGGGCESIELDHLKMRHDDGTSTIIQTGRNLVFLMSGTDPDVSWINMHDCHIYGGDAAITLTGSGTLGFAWINDILFTKVHSTHSKYFMLFNMPGVTGIDPLVHVTKSMVHRWVFRDCSFQTTATEATTLYMFRLVNDLVLYRGIIIDGCMMWDPASTNNKFLHVVGTDVRMTVRNSEPIGDAFMGGTAWDATNNKWLTPGGVFIKREGEFSEARGVALAVTDGTTITHGMKDYGAASTSVAIAPKRVFVQGTVAGEDVTVTSISTTGFTVAVKKASTTAGSLVAGTSQTVYWRAEAYN